MKSHAHPPIIQTLHHKILHLLPPAPSLTDIKDGHTGRATPIPRRQRIHHPPGRLQIEHARIEALARHLGDLLARVQIDLDQAVLPDVGDEAGIGQPRHGRPTRRLLALDLGDGDGGGGGSSRSTSRSTSSTSRSSEVGEVERGRAKRGVGGKDLRGTAGDGHGAEEHRRAAGGLFGVGDADGARDRVDGEDADEAREGGRGGGVPLDGGDERGGGFVEEGGADAVEGAGGGVGLLEVEGPEGVEGRGYAVLWGEGGAG